MRNRELSIKIGELIGVPNVSMRGVINPWQDFIIGSVLTGFRDKNVTTLVLDIASLSFAEKESEKAIIETLKNASIYFNIHVATKGRFLDNILKADLGENVQAYKSTDEIASHIMAEV